MSYTEIKSSITSTGIEIECTEFRNPTYPKVTEEFKITVVTEFQTLSY